MVHFSRSIAVSLGSAWSVLALGKRVQEHGAPPVIHGSIATGSNLVLFSFFLLRRSLAGVPAAAAAVQTLAQAA
eukprot:1157388-Pelagomonas_calceolata.AAC.16